jgi:hypothetical protein
MVDSVWRGSRLRAALVCLSCSVVWGFGFRRTGLWARPRPGALVGALVMPRKIWSGPVLPLPEISRGGHGILPSKKPKPKRAAAAARERSRSGRSWGLRLGELTGICNMRCAQGHGPLRCRCCSGPGRATTCRYRECPEEALSALQAPRQEEDHCLKPEARRQRKKTKPNPNRGSAEAPGPAQKSLS